MIMNSFAIFPGKMPYNKKVPLFPHIKKIIKRAEEARTVVARAEQPQASAVKPIPLTLILYGQVLPEGHLAVIVEEAQALNVFADLMTSAQSHAGAITVLAREENAPFLALCRGFSVDLQVMDSQFTHTQLRERAEKVWQVQQPSMLVLGRYLGALWPTMLNILKRSTATGQVTVVADVTLQTKLPLPLVFRHYLVDQANEQLFEHALERWHRHESFKPLYVKRWLGGGISLYTRQ